MGIRLSPKLHRVNQDTLIYWCPGCKMLHPVYLSNSAQPNGHSWIWDGESDKPTFSPSIVVKLAEDKICHCFISEGIISYLGDCFHEYRNQKVPLPDIPREEY